MRHEHGQAAALRPARQLLRLGWNAPSAKATTMDQQVQAAWPDLLSGSPVLYRSMRRCSDPFRSTTPWSTYQSEWATDILFRDAASLARLYSKTGASRPDHLPQPRRDALPGPQHPAHRQAAAAVAGRGNQRHEATPRRRADQASPGYSLIKMYDKAVPTGLDPKRGQRAADRNHDHLCQVGSRSSVPAAGNQRRITDVAGMTALSRYLSNELELSVPGIRSAATDPCRERLAGRGYDRFSSACRVDWPLWSLDTTSPGSVRRYWDHRPTPADWRGGTALGEGWSESLGPETKQVRRLTVTLCPCRHPRESARGFAHLIAVPFRSPCLDGSHGNAPCRAGR